MTRVDAYLFKNSLKVILKLIEAPTLDDTAKTRIKAEIDAMIQILDQVRSNKYNNNVWPRGIGESHEPLAK